MVWAFVGFQRGFRSRTLKRGPQTRVPLRLAERWPADVYILKLNKLARVALAVAAPKDGFEVLNKSCQVRSQGDAESPNLHDVQAPFAPLALADERLRGSQSFRKFFLSDAQALPRPLQQAQHRGVVAGMDRLLQAR